MLHYPETESPVISAYFDTTEAPEAMRLLISIWSSSVRSTFCRNQQKDFEQAKTSIIDVLSDGWPPGSRSLAVFARGGDNPMKIGIPLGANYSSILDESLDAFVAAEYAESVQNVERLHQEIRRSGLGVVGIENSLKAVREGSADLLIISENLPDEERESLVRLATLRDVSIEVCEDAPLIDDYGGVGCLLRYRADFVTAVIEEAANP